MNVKELLARTSSRELSEWLAYERIAGPLGPRRGDIQAALIAMTIANVNRGKGKAPFTLDKFLFKWDQGRSSPEEILQQVSAFNHQVGGTVTTADSG